MLHYAYDGTSDVDETETCWVLLVSGGFYFSMHVFDFLGKIKSLFYTQY